MELDIKSKLSSIAKDGDVDQVLTYLQELFENMPIPSAIIDQDFIIEDISRQFLEIFDYERNEVIGKNILDFIDFDSHDIFLNSINKLSNFDSISGVEFQMIKKDGSKIDVSFSAKIGNKYSEDTLNIFCIIDDITLKKSFQENFETKNAELSILLDNIEAHIWYLKDRETYGFSNKAHADFFGRSADYFKNRNLYDFLPKEVAEQCIKGNDEVYFTKKTILPKNTHLIIKAKKEFLRLQKLLC